MAVDAGQWAARPGVRHCDTLASPWCLPISRKKPTNTHQTHHGHPAAGSAVQPPVHPPLADVPRRGWRHCDSEGLHLCGHRPGGKWQRIPETLPLANRRQGGQGGRRSSQHHPQPGDQLDRLPTRKTLWGGEEGAGSAGRQYQRIETKWQRIPETLPL